MILTAIALVLTHPARALTTCLTAATALLALAAWLHHLDRKGAKQ